MVKDKLKIIKQIAENLDCGNDCYYNPKSNEIVTIPNFSHWLDGDEFEDVFKAELVKVRNQKSDFIKFEVLESFESFKIMERFVEQVADLKLQKELEAKLTQKNPFRKFKYVIDHSDFRQKWFDFKQTEIEKIVESQLDASL